MLVLHDGCMLQRIFDGSLKTNKTKVNVKVWQKHATATLTEPSVLSSRDSDNCVGFVFVAQQTPKYPVDTPNASQISVTDSLNHYN